MAFNNAGIMLPLADAADEPAGASTASRPSTCAAYGRA
jgi:hypothetical protein